MHTFCNTTFDWITSEIFDSMFTKALDTDHAISDIMLLIKRVPIELVTGPRSAVFVQG